MIADILPSLNKAKQTGAGNWLACCPAHEDRNPSLTIHEAQDGRILVRCFAGCAFEEIVNAVGLGWDPWFPPKQDTDFKGPIRRPFPAADVLAAVESEAYLVMICACDVVQGKEITEDTKDRLIAAVARIGEARRLALGQ